jgi:lipid-binding SYLF domain-containing protein
MTAKDIPSARPKVPVLPSHSREVTMTFRQYIRSIAGAVVAAVGVIVIGVAAGPVGWSAGAATDALMQASMLSYYTGQS